MADSKSAVYEGKLTVNVHEARGLKKAALIGGIDPYAKLEIADESFKTKVVAKGGRTPKFGQSFLLYVLFRLLV